MWTYHPCCHHGNKMGIRLASKILCLTLSNEDDNWLIKTRTQCFSLHMLDGWWDVLSRKYCTLKMHFYPNSVRILARLRVTMSLARDQTKVDFLWVNRMTSDRMRLGDLVSPRFAAYLFWNICSKLRGLKPEAKLLAPMYPVNFLWCILLLKFCSTLKLF